MLITILSESEVLQTFVTVRVKVTVLPDIAVVGIV